MPNPTKSSLIKRCTELRVTLIDAVDYVSIIAPHGHELAGGTHEIRIECRGWTRPEIYAELWEGLTRPPEKCNCPDCEWCTDAPGLPYGVAESMALTPITC